MAIGFCENEDGEEEQEEYEGLTELSLPRFRVETSHESLEEQLKQIGITKIFENIDTEERLGTAIFIESVKQKALIDLNETGITAAAATLFGIKDGAGTAEPELFVCDRPFYFALILGGEVLMVTSFVGE